MEKRTVARVEHRTGVIAEEGRPRNKYISVNVEELSTKSVDTDVIVRALGGTSDNKIDTVLAY